MNSTSMLTAWPLIIGEEDLTHSQSQRTPVIMRLTMRSTRDTNWVSLQRHAFATSSLHSILRAANAPIALSFLAF